MKLEHSVLDSDDTMKSIKQYSTIYKYIILYLCLSIKWMWLGTVVVINVTIFIIQKITCTLLIN